MLGGSAEPISYNTTGEADGGGGEIKMTEHFINHDFVVNKKPTEDELQIYKDAISKSQFINNLWMDMAVTKFWSRSSGNTCGDVIRFCRFPFLWLLAMALMLYFPIVLINDYWPSSIECMSHRHGWTVILASEAIIIYLFSITGFNKWTLSDESQQVRNQSTWCLYIMLSSHSTRHKWVVIFGHLANVVCRGFLITATAFSLIYSDPELEEILIRGVEMHFLMEVPNVMRFMSKERMVNVLVSGYEQNGVKVVNYDTWQRQHKWLILVNGFIESAALLWSIALPIIILFCM